MLNIDFLIIRGKLILFVAVLLSCMALVYLSNMKLDHVREDNRLYDNNIRTNKSSIGKIINDRSLVKRYQDGFNSLSLSGFLDKENRLSWIEQLEKTAKKLELPDLTYQIDPQRKAESERFQTPVNINLLQSTLNFESSLLHEGDLQTLINDLVGMTSGLLVVERCELNRVAKNLGVPSNHNFNGICDISLYTAIYKDFSNNDMDDDI